MATPCRPHRLTVSRISSGLPAWKPQAMLAELMKGSREASSPTPSPKSQLKSMLGFISMRNRTIYFPLRFLNIRRVPIAIRTKAGSGLAFIGGCRLPGK